MLLHEEREPSLRAQKEKEKRERKGKAKIDNGGVDNGVG
jgi:hypothetical protein